MKIVYLFLSRSLAPVMFDMRVFWLAFYCRAEFVFCRADIGFCNLRGHHKQKSC